MRIKYIIPASALIAAPATYLLWPLKSDGFKITWDEAATAKKHAFLESQQVAPDLSSLPNILLIVADDLGVNDISFYGQGKVSTPNIDRIGHSGVSFDQAYTASPICSPARASLLTGRYPQRFGFQQQMHDRYLKNRLEYYGFKFLVDADPWYPADMDKVPRKRDIDMQGLPPSEVTLSELLKARGYNTALIGKWHLGSDERNKPCQFGFDYQFGFFDSNSLYAPEGSEGITDQKIEDDFTDQYMWKDGRKGPRAIYRNCEPVEEPEHLTDAITRECISYMRQDQGKPFFIMAAYNAPHTPLQAPDQYVEMFRDEPDPVKRVYYAMIKQLDDNIGELLGELENQGLTGNTMVIFLSDNGGATYTHTTDNGPLRGGKVSDFEGGLSVPFFICWPDSISPGTSFHAPVMTFDIFATLLGAAGLQPPDESATDAANLLRYINKGDSLLPHTHLYWQRGPSKAIRSLEWKVIWNEEYGDTLIYNIEHDPNELNDLFSTHKELARQLILVHQDWSGQLPPPLWPSVIHFREEVDGRDFWFDN